MTAYHSCKPLSLAIAPRTQKRFLLRPSQASTTSSRVLDDKSEHTIDSTNIRWQKLTHNCSPLSAEDSCNLLYVTTVLVGFLFLPKNVMLVVGILTSVQSHGGGARDGEDEEAQVKQEGASAKGQIGSSKSSSSSSSSSSRTCERAEHGRNERGRKRGGEVMPVYLAGISTGAWYSVVHAWTDTHACACGSLHTRVRR